MGRWCAIERMSMVGVMAKPVEQTPYDDLVVRAKTQAGALAELYELYYDRIYRFCVHRLYSKAAAEDITSGVFVTVAGAMRQFKGGEPNRKPGQKVRVKVSLDESLAGTETIVLSQSSLDTMAAEPGDLLYASHTRWWYGGLRSVHVKAGPVAPAENDTLLIGPDSAATARFVDGQEVVVEKIM